MIPINIYPEEIQLLKEKEFYTDLKHLTSHTIQTPSGYSFNFKYNVSLQKNKLSPHLHNNIDIHLYKIYSKSKKLIINNEDDVGNFPTFIHFFHYLIII
ncbi:conserved rodent malaria protein, unknown function [Plasmodium berghei]|uniref:Uncharacterized protein n=1 Tax=Plasmodium berghei TaxID=5821 RepID=A0A1C6W969_PLABE|nr:conserved rodent malaria protein, unknown function [Plasmodium berghei]